MVVAPLSIHLERVQKLIREDIGVASQNLSHKGKGAFTGEVAGE